MLVDVLSYQWSMPFGKANIAFMTLCGIFQIVWGHYFIAILPFLITGVALVVVTIIRFFVDRHFQKINHPELYEDKQ